uniref:Uncharacterized protein n=1 Tax=Euplotes harpa TaxID=151035 RepID=A0A7S3N933_9SPIT|mmetsp:Transcript_35514/g.41103  ORF Transcript_35514/g.41103 Transcript_35514/m.41103 type:complete len:138 (+) Transcript_35514:289-702(+)
MVSPMCKFVERIVELLIEPNQANPYYPEYDGRRMFMGPVTFINEFRTTKEAAIKILRGQQVDKNQPMIPGSFDSSLFPNSIVHGQDMKFELMHQKSVYDAIAAQCILERFIQMYREQPENNDEHEEEPLEQPDNKYL